MRDLFPGFYPPEKADLDAIWNEGSVVLDANVLLDAFRYSKTTLEQLLDIIEGLGDRVWIPYQAAHEYHQNLPGVLDEHAKSSRNAADDAAKLYERLTSERRHPFVSAELMDRVNALFPDLIDGLRAAEEEVDGLLRENPVQIRLSGLLQGKVGTRFPEETLQEIYKTAKTRYERRQPPGYKDRDKEPEERRFGDYIIWREMLAHAAESERPVMFVTSDTKEDWFLEVRGKTIGPRPELVQEFADVTGQPFHMYPTHRFLELAADNLAAQVSPEAVSEAKDLRRSHAAVQPYVFTPEQMRAVREALVPSFALDPEVYRAMLAIQSKINLGMGPTGGIADLLANNRELQAQLFQQFAFEKRLKEGLLGGRRQTTPEDAHDPDPSPDDSSGTALPPGKDHDVEGSEGEDPDESQ